MSREADALFAYGYDLGFFGTENKPNFQLQVAEQLDLREDYLLWEDHCPDYIEWDKNQNDESWFDHIKRKKKEFLETEKGQRYKEAQELVENYFPEEVKTKGYGESNRRYALVSYYKIYSERGRKVFEGYPENHKEHSKNLDLSDLFELLDLEPEEGPDWLILPRWV